MLKVIPEPDFTQIIRNYGSLSVHYIPDRTIAQRLGITTNLLGRMTGNVYVIPGDNERSQNIGLKLKYSGQNKEVCTTFSLNFSSFFMLLYFHLPGTIVCLS